MFLLGQIKKQCFNGSDYDKANDWYCDGDGFTAAVSPGERDALFGFIDGLWNEYGKLQEKLQQTKRR
jgi:hypothetical protein